MYVASPAFVSTSARERLNGGKPDTSFYDRLCRQDSASSVYSRSSSFDSSSSNMLRRYGSTSSATSSLSRPLPVGPRDYHHMSTKPPLPPTRMNRSYAAESYAAHRPYGGTHARSLSVDRHDGQVHQLTSRFERLSGSDTYGSPSVSHRTLPYRSSYTHSFADDDNESRDSVGSLPNNSTATAGLYRSRIGAASMPDVPSYASQTDSKDRVSFSRGDAVRSSASSVDSWSSSGVYSGRKELSSRSSSPSSDWSSAKSGYETETLSPSSRCGLVGLQNLGNTCFMNSILQCLSHTKPLRTFCLKDCSSADINNNTSRMKGALMKSFCDLLTQLWSESRSYITPDHFKSQIQKFAPRFVGYSQQDAQEFLRYVLWGLHEDVNRVRSKPGALPLIDDNLPDATKAIESWKRYARIDNSKIVDVFVGQLKSELRCSHCNNVSTTFDPFWDLSLQIPQDRRSIQVSLQDCLDAFTREEVLDGDEKPKCDKCNSHRRCTKKLSIYKFPSILVLHLKRFSGERYRSRLSTLVTFPTRALDLSKFSSDPNVGVSYNLYGVSNHSGTPLMGHYTAYVCHATGSKWQLYDDTRVTSVGEKSVVSSEAYVLFYELSKPHETSRL